MTVRRSIRSGSERSAPPTCHGDSVELLRTTEAAEPAGTAERAAAAADE